ncbi:XRE family transcriptional regulator [Ectopseudomonas hydrolytica]|uniref:Putative phage repressor n=1 Tax=Ectopseudomonas mendocina (strain ymp) TaxID=399739 RepID=A4XZG4_ECTM1
METLGQRLKRLRKAKGMSQQALAEECGWASQSRIGNYEADLRAPSLSDLLLIAPALGVSLAELAGSDEWTGAYGVQVQVKNHQVRESVGAETIEAGTAKEGAVPVVGNAKLGTDGYFEAVDFPVGHGDGYLLIHSDDPNAYGLKVLGDSMHPRIKNGEYVLIEPNKVFTSGDEVMVKTKDGQAMIKEFIYLRDGMYRFDSVNQSHQPIHLPEDAIDKIHLVGGILKSSRFTHDYHTARKK